METVNQDRQSNLVLLSYLQKESNAVSSAQQSIKSFLNTKHISIDVSNSTNMNKIKSSKRVRHLITLSTKSNNIECRVSLERAPINSKCIAPCACSGTQKWIQFSLLNKLRRKDPDQWKVCRTCQQKFDYSFVNKYGGIYGNLLTVLLDNPLILRTLIGLMLGIAIVTFQLPMLVTRVLVSKIFWQAYPRWSRLTHLPFVFLIWGAKIALQNIFDLYLVYEKKLMMLLTQIESSIVEPMLPITDDQNL